MEKVVRIQKLHQGESDFAFWQKQPPEKRLEALEEIRKEYNDWKYGTDIRFQRVYRIIKRTRG